MAINKTITQNSQHGTVEATATSASGRSAVITFDFTWDEIENKPLSYTRGKVTIEEAEVAAFSLQNSVLSVQTSDRTDFGDYATMISNAIKELETSME